MFHRSFRSVVVITSASHAEGRRFKPGRKHSFHFYILFSRVWISRFVHGLFYDILYFTLHTGAMPEIWIDQSELSRLRLVSLQHFYHCDDAYRCRRIRIQKALNHFRFVKNIFNNHLFLPEINRLSVIYNSFSHFLFAIIQKSTIVCPLWVVLTVGRLLCRLFQGENRIFFKRSILIFFSN